jgi:cysteine synthase
MKKITGFRADHELTFMIGEEWAGRGVEERMGGGLDGIGRTPITRLSQLPDEGSAEVWVKLEAANPTGSYKDRMALAMIEAAERDGRLRPGQTVVEYTGGSTGSSLAFVCAVKGYPLRIVSSDAFAVEKIRTMRAFGAEVELLPSPDGITPRLIPAMMSRAREIAAEIGAFQTDQMNNTDMIDGYRRLGEEIVDQLPGADAFCAYVGTAGCFLGTTRALRAAWPQLHRAVVEPAESAVLSGGQPGVHRIEGGGIGRWPPQLRPEDFDEAIPIPQERAFAVARRAARAEGILSGPSTGANLAAALDLARRLGSGHRVVTVQVDSGLKYLGGDLYSE